MSVMLDLQGARARQRIKVPVGGERARRIMPLGQRLCIAGDSVAGVIVMPRGFEDALSHTGVRRNSRPPSPEQEHMAEQPDAEVRIFGRLSPGSRGSV